MATIRVSATKARNNFFELLNQVMLGINVVVERDNKEVAIISPKREKIDWEAFRKAADKVRGILRDYDPNDNPLRKPEVANFLGRWDKDLKFKAKR